MCRALRCACAAAALVLSGCCPGPRAARTRARPTPRNGTTVPHVRGAAAAAAAASLRDRDGDGILDRCDKCPDKPESYNGYRDDDGCPERYFVTSSWHPFLRFVYFKEASAAIQSHQRDVIRWAARALRSGDTAVLACVGAIAPNEKGGLALAWRRARAACAAIAALGVAPSHLETYAVSGREFSPGGPVRPPPLKARRSWARRAAMVTVMRKPKTWYQRPWRTLRFDGATLVRANDKPATRPSGPPRCPHEKRSR